MICERTAETYPHGFEENDRLRSQFVRDFLMWQVGVRGVPSERHAPSKSGEHVPRTMFQYWHDSGDLPADVRDCMRTWDSLRDAGVEYRLFDDDLAAAYIARWYSGREVAAFARCKHPAKRSDYLRLCVILNEGGLYVDADDVLLGDNWGRLFEGTGLKVQPLCYDAGAGRMATMLQLAQAGFPAGDRIYYINNNPIAAPPMHPALRRALARATTRLLGHSPDVEIQETTGPGNFTAAIAAHSRESSIGGTRDVHLLVDWESTSAPRWDLDYRNDDRNWRNVYGC